MWGNVKASTACLLRFLGGEMNAGSSRVLELRIPADTRYIAMVRRGVRNLAESVGFTREAVCDMEVAVSEAVTNSVQHGSPDPVQAAVIVKCTAYTDWFVVEVEDDAGSDHLPIPSILPDPPDEHGRGLLMMRQLMDEFEDTRTDHGLKVRMAKQKIRS